ncbi:YoaK family protein [Vulgatibacter incomptus]|uniref:Putative transmembrane protein n=1 Tax=Vulgatibacter incomptus TaxID=1391653 RepID=A0A0K1PBG6_9BACT|nr:YoaK family protein [Vulgatibacter incomptus]AKU90469.1 putative transmembrane protein [Vulgatibacter incomptus]
MLHSEGQDRSFASNAILAIALACVAGIVNAAGFFAVGAYTSHVTGNVSQVGDELARGRPGTALAALSLVLFFLLGVMAAAAFVQGASRLGRARYAAALITEAAVLTAFTAISAFTSGRPEWLHLLLTGMLCFSMGMQNALVTRLSGAVIRTTHLTGIATDLGIELVSLVSWIRERASEASSHGVAAFLRDLWRHPELRKLWLHASIFVAFLGGAIIGPMLYLRHGHVAMLLPGSIILGLVILDLSGRVQARPAKARAAEVVAPQE